MRVGAGDLDVKVGFSNRNDEIGDLGRSFNHMVQQLYESREEWNGSTAPRCRVRNAWPHSENLRLGSPTKSAIRSQVSQA